MQLEGIDDILKKLKIEEKEFNEEIFREVEKSENVGDEYIEKHDLYYIYKELKYIRKILKNKKRFQQLYNFLVSLGIGLIIGFCVGRLI